MAEQPVEIPAWLEEAVAHCVRTDVLTPAEAEACARIVARTIARRNAELDQLRADAKLVEYDDLPRRDDGKYTPAEGERLRNAIDCQYAELIRLRRRSNTLETETAALGDRTRAQAAELEQLRARVAELERESARYDAAWAGITAKVHSYFAFDAVLKVAANAKAAGIDRALVDAAQEAVTKMGAFAIDYEPTRKPTSIAVDDLVQVHAPGDPHHLWIGVVREIYDGSPDHEPSATFEFWGGFDNRADRDEWQAGVPLSKLVRLRRAAYRHDGTPIDP